MPDVEKYDWSFYPPAVNVCYDYGASRLFWQCMANVNETIEIKSLVYIRPKLYVGNDITSGGVTKRSIL